jgi:hypothetical protein
MRSYSTPARFKAKHRALGANGRPWRFCLLFILERRFGAEGDSYQVRNVTGDHELTRLLVGDRLSKSFLAGLNLTPASPDNVMQALGIRLCDCRCSRSDSAGFRKGMGLLSASWNRGLLAFALWMVCMIRLTLG